MREETNAEKEKKASVFLATGTRTDGKSLWEKRRGGAAWRRRGVDYRRSRKRRRRKRGFCQELLSLEDE